MARKNMKIILLCLFFMLHLKIYAGSIDNIHIHGFISQGYMQSDKNNYLADTEAGTFQFNEMGINFVNQPTQKLKIGIQFFARDLGSSDNDTVCIDWAFADYHFKDYLGIRGGRVKIPFGLYNESRDIDMLKTCILLPTSVYPEEYRDTFLAINGLSIYGGIILKRAGYFNYNFSTGTTNVRSNGGTALTIGQSSFDIKSIDVEYAHCANLKWLDPGEHIKLAGSVGGITKGEFKAETTSYAPDILGLPSGLDVDVTSDDSWGWILSAELTINSIVFSSEYRRFFFNTSTTFPSLSSIIPPYAIESKEEGYYGLISYRINSLMEIGTYYSVYYSDFEDKNGDRFAAQQRDRFEAWRKDAALSLRFDLNENWLLKLEGHYIDGVAPILDKMNPDGFDRYWKLFLAKISFVF